MNLQNPILHYPQPYIPQPQIRTKNRAKLRNLKSFGGCILGVWGVLCVRVVLGAILLSPFPWSPTEVRNFLDNKSLPRLQTVCVKSWHLELSSKVLDRDFRGFGVQVGLQLQAFRLQLWQTSSKNSYRWGLKMYNYCGPV